MKKSEITKAIKETLQEEKPGLWANIRAKRARGEKPAHKNSNAHKDAVAAGKKINAMKEGKGSDLANKIIDLARKAMKNLTDEDVQEFREYIALAFDLKSESVNEGEGKTLQDLEMGEKFTFNGSEYTFIELYPELPSAARVILPNGRKSVVSFGGKVNTGKKAGIGPDYFGQGKGHHID